MNKSRSHYTEPLAAVFRAVSECRAKPAGDPQRIIIVLSPGDGRRAAPPLATVVVVDAALFGPQELETLARLVNRTRAVPVLRVSEEAWRAWARRWPRQSAQIRRRTHLIVRLDQPSTQEII
jgi:hypothetical protein